MTVKTYDVNSFLLAEQFMEDRPQGMTREQVQAFTHDLACEIQQAVEDWFEERGRTGWAPVCGGER